MNWPCATLRLTGQGATVLLDNPFSLVDGKHEALLSSALSEKPKAAAWAAEFDARSWAQFFLKFVLAHPAVTVVTPATSKAKHMADNLGAAFGRTGDHGAARLPARRGLRRHGEAERRIDGDREEPVHRVRARANAARAKRGALLIRALRDRRFHRARQRAARRVFGLYHRAVGRAAGAGHRPH